MNTTSANPISEALDQLTLAIAAEGVQHVTRDPAVFAPSPVGVLVTTPRITSAGLNTITMEVDVMIVSTNPPTARSLDLILTTTLAVMEAVQAGEANPTTWAGGPNLDPLPAYTVTATITTPSY